MESTTVIVDGIGMTALFAARLIVSNIHRQCAVEIDAVSPTVLCQVWPAVVREESGLHLVRWHDASGSLRAMARV